MDLYTSLVLTKPRAKNSFLVHHSSFGYVQDMVVLPYKDSLLLFSRYLQQLVMESLGKEYDLDGNLVSEGMVRSCRSSTAFLLESGWIINVCYSCR